MRLRQLLIVAIIIDTVNIIASKFTVNFIICKLISLHLSF